MVRSRLLLHFAFGIRVDIAILTASCPLLTQSRPACSRTASVPWKRQLCWHEKRNKRFSNITISTCRDYV